MSTSDWWRRIWEGLRPLDPIRSIKMKFAVLLATSGFLTGLIELIGVKALGWHQRYTLVVAILVSLVISQLIAHGMTSPLRQMTAAARELAQGRPAPAVRTSSRDEVGELARAFTMMSRELAAVDTQRRELLANVGHELRTPVAALRAQLENLADGVRPADPAALAEVLGQVERLGDLLNDLLDLARAEGGAVPLERRQISVLDLVQGVVAQVGTARAGSAIEVRVEPPDLTVDADPYRLGQVLTNLVDNATRYAGAGGTVQVAAHAGPGGRLVLQVTDDGPGIPPERWESVFERFSGGTGEIPLDRPDGSRPTVGRTAQDGGTGLGLAIARWAVVLHGGTIAVVPVEPGGCRIRVEIPAGEATA
jgi:signal transduction histidine kinase